MRAFPALPDLPVLSPAKPQNGQHLWSAPSLHTRTWQFRKSAVGMGCQLGWEARGCHVNVPRLPHPVSPTLQSLTGPLPPTGGHLAVSAESSPYFGFYGHQGLRKHRLAHNTHPLWEDTSPTEGPVGAVFLKGKNRGRGVK